MQGILKYRSFIVAVLVAFGAVVLAGCESAEERAQSHYQRGVELVAQGDLIKASIEFRNALQLKDDYVPAMFALGEIDERQGRLESALGLFRNVSERDPRHVEARVHLARLLLLGGQVDEALKLADQAYAVAPSDASVLATKGAVALALENPDDSIRFADEALKIDPDNLDALMLRAAERLKATDPKAAIVFLDKAEGKNERNLALQLLRLTALELLKDKQGVERVFQKLGGFYPKDERFRDGLAQWYFSEGRTDDAERVLRKFAADSPENVQAQLVVVDFLGRTKGADAARAELESLIAKGGDVFPFELALAQLSVGSGDYDGAVARMTKLIAETDDREKSATAKILLARMMAGKQDWAGAGRLVDEVIAADSKNADALTVRAGIRIFNGQLPDAIKDLREALDQAPQSSRVLLIMADAYERSGDAALAEEQLGKAVRIEKFRADVALAYVQFLMRYGKADQAERVLIEARSAAPGNKQILTLLGQLRLNRKDWAGAQEIAETLGRLGDQQSQASANQILAAVLGAQQKDTESIDLLKAAVADAPGQASPMAALVAAYVRAGNPEAAEQFLATVLKDDPDNIGALVLRGSLFALQNKPGEAEAAFKAAVDKDPKSPVGYQALARYYLQIGRMDDAEKTARSGLEHQSEDAALRLVLGSVLESGGRYEDAIGVYEMMFKSDPLSVVAANNLASLLAEYRDDKESIDRARAIAGRFRDSDIPQFLDTLGWTYYRTGEFAQAVTLLKAAADKLSSFAVVQYHLGMAYKALGEPQLAIASLEKAMALADKGGSFPQRAKARLALDELAKDAPAPEKTN